MKNHIVIIDTGIDLEHRDFVLRKDIINTYSVEIEDDKYFMMQGCKDEVGHGTAIASIISKECNENVILSIIKIFNDNEYTSVESLIFALEYVYENINCNIINISLGTTVYDNRLLKICNLITQKNIIIVSAFSNNGCMSYPAFFENVIGVDVHPSCKTKDSYIYTSNNNINILGMGGNHRLAWLDNKYTIRQGASFTTAYISALIIKWLQNGMKVEDCDKNLKKYAKKILEKKEVLKNTNDKFEKQRIALFPYNKEMHSVINFSEMVKGTITDVYDVKYLRNCGKTITNFEKTNIFTVKNIDNIDWDKFDCLVIGHVDEIEKCTCDDIKTNLLEKCLLYNKNVFCFDNSKLENFYNRFKEKNLIIYTPEQKKEICFQSGKLHLIKSPVVGIMGTSNKQGKFTLQLNIRKELLKRKYKVGQLGTEPNAPLFGIDETIHFGYSGTVKLEGSSFVEFINEKIHDIDINEPDIVLVGNQAGTILRYAYNVEHLRIPEIEFLIATNPDCIVLCANIYDDIGYIQRSINTIENLIDTKVIAIALSPFIYPNDTYLMYDKKVFATEEQIEESCNFLRDKFKIPVFSLRYNNNITNIVDCIIDFFGG